MNPKILFGWLAVALLGLILVIPTLAQTGSGYDLTWNNVAGGGGVSSGTGYELIGGNGQAIAGLHSADGYTLGGGFWGASAHAPTSTPLSTSTPTATPTPTPTATPTPFYSVVIAINPVTTQVKVGDTLDVAVNVQNQSTGCLYSPHDLLLTQIGQDAPVFGYLSPQQVGPPVPEPATFRLIANKPGAVTLSILAFGERNCGNGRWEWLHDQGASSTITVLATPPPTIDLVADALEVTQGIQDLVGSVPLVQDKRTFVRFHVHANSGLQSTEAILRVERNQSTNDVIYLNPINIGGLTFVMPEADNNRQWAQRSFWFELPNGYRSGGLTLTAELNHTRFGRTREPLEFDYNNNRVSTSAHFEPVPTVNLVIYKVGYKLNNVTHYPSQQEADQMADWLRRLYPLSELHVWHRQYKHTDHFPTSCAEVNGTLLIKKIWDLVTFSGIAAHARYYGMLSDDGGFTRGYATSIPSYVACGTTWRNNADHDWTGGHELGHTYGRAHAGCSPDGPIDIEYPYPNGRISPELSGERAIFGFDIRTDQIYTPDWNDVMSYCDDHIWISDYTYRKIFEFFQFFPVQAADRRQLQQTDRLLVVGTIDADAKRATVQPLFVIPNAGDVEERTPGDYAIVLRTGVGTELARYPFTPDPIIGEAPPSAAAETVLLGISELVPYVASTQRVEIVGPGGILLASVSAGAAPPVVTVTTPNGGETLTGESISVAWTANDPDGDPLTFDVQYSPNNGASWEMLAQNITGNSVVIDQVNLVAGTQGLFRVWVSDGIHTASDQSDIGFIVPNHAPIAHIINPAGAATLVVSSTLGLRAEAYDVENGTLHDGQVQWTSTLDGVLGDGLSVSTAALSIGAHQITLRADDGAGGVATDTITVTVVSDNSQLPLPTSRLQANPDQIYFYPAEGWTNVTIALTHTYGDSLRWNAIADQPWVQLSATTGNTTPALLTATFNPTGLSGGIYTATITVTSPDMPDERIILPVNAKIIGNRIFLPIVER
jgi:hypothetical protein